MLKFFTHKGIACTQLDWVTNREQHMTKLLNIIDI